MDLRIPIMRVKEYILYNQLLHTSEVKHVAVRILGQHPIYQEKPFRGVAQVIKAQMDTCLVV